MASRKELSIKGDLSAFGAAAEAGVMLHVCCAPCSGAIIEALAKEGIRPVVFFSNSNIAPKEEYELRLRECRRYCDKYGLELIEDEYDHCAWVAAAARGREQEPERGSRCQACFRFRLLRAAREASRRGLGLLATSLASSRWKDLAQVDEAGRFACSLFPGLRWWGRNWRAGGLQQRRSEIICEENFYNQNYCGCEFSHH